MTSGALAANRQSIGTRMGSNPEPTALDMALAEITGPEKQHQEAQNLLTQVQQVDPLQRLGFGLSRNLEASGVNTNTDPCVRTSQS